MPDEATMFRNFFDQVRLADELEFGTAWVAETHLSCEIQKSSVEPVIPHFKGEIGLNTDILQLAHVVMGQTKRIHIGSAIRNIFCNGGPIAHAEAIRTFLTLHGLHPSQKRLLEIGFASGRFDFSNRPYGITPRNAVERAAWPVVKGKFLLEATEIFLRLLKGEQIARADVQNQSMSRADFRSDADWDKVLQAAGGGKGLERLELEPRWSFEKVGVIPFASNLDLLRLTIGTHDPLAQKLANTILPTGVFNLSITPPAVIEETHRRMTEWYHPAGGPWRRDLMPRTAMIFVDKTREAAKIAAEKAWVTYWKAMEGTIDSKKVEQAVQNTLAGSPEDLVEAIMGKYHPDDRLMLWFDFNNHDNQQIMESMSTFMQKVAPHLK